MALSIKNSHFGPKIVTSGLVLALDAGNTKSYPGSGTTWTDLSGRGNNGTLTNGPTYSSSNGGSIVFDGVNDYVNIGDVDFNSTFSFSMWLKGSSTQIGVYCGLLNKSSSSNMGAGGFYGDQFSSYVRFGFVDSGNIQYETSNSLYNDIKANTWVNYVGTYNLSNIRLYRNSVEISSTETNAIPVQTNDSLGVGARPVLISGGTNYCFTGNIAQVSIYNRALTAAEIQQNFNALRGRFGI